MKKCFKCLTVKPLDDYYKHPQMGDGHLNKCKECTKKDVQMNYTSNIDKYREYDYTRQRTNKKRILNHRYNQIKQRIEGRAVRNYKVNGKPMLTYDEWGNWTTAHMDKFDEIYQKWHDSGFKRAFAPSIDRINPDGSYTVDNIQWLSVSENSSKGNKERW